MLLLDVVLGQSVRYVDAYWARWAEETGGDIGDEMRQRIARMDVSWCVEGAYATQGSDPRVGRVQAGHSSKDTVYVAWSDGSFESRVKVVELTEASESDLTEEMRRGISYAETKP